MTIQLEAYQIFLVLVTIIGAVVGMIKMLGSQIKSNIDQHFDSTNQKIEHATKQAQKSQDQIHELERRFYQLQIDIPNRYIARDDYIRGQTVIEAKLDAVAEQVKTVQIHQGIK